MNKFFKYLLYAGVAFFCYMYLNHLLSYIHSGICGINVRNVLIATIQDILPGICLA